jgi:serine/threonine-protein kinase
MLSTTHIEITPTLNLNGDRPDRSRPDELVERYDKILEEKRLNWTTHHRLMRQLGEGGQGVVYLTERRGADGFTLPIALKVFSPANYDDAAQYDEAMARMARVAVRVAQIQQDNLIDVHNFLDRNRIRMMEMEWVDGYDLRRLMVPEMIARVENRVSARRWEYINRVIVTQGPIQPRVKPGVAVAILRDCLAALAALHREGIVHGDIKPSNIMLKRTGTSKLVDMGSAFDLDDPPTPRTCTPAYAAPEVLDNNETTPRSDLASLGYVLIELLGGRPPFAGLTNCRDLLEAKRFLAQRLNSILPEDVTRNDLLMHLVRGLIAPDPNRRFPTAQDADLQEQGAAAFHRQLVKGDLAAEYDNEIRLWLEELDDLTTADEPTETA